MAKRKKEENTQLADNPETVSKTTKGAAAQSTQPNAPQAQGVDNEDRATSYTDASSVNDLSVDPSLIKEWEEEIRTLNEEQLHKVLLTTINNRVFWHTVSYMRRYPERLVSNNNCYADNCVGGEELAGYMGFTQEDSYGARWLDEHHVPTLAEAEIQRTLADAQIDTIFSHGVQTSISRMKTSFNLDRIEFEILCTMVCAMSVEPLLRLMSVAWADFSVRQPTVSFVCTLIARPYLSIEEIYEAFAEKRTLRRMRLVMVEKHAKFPNFTPLHFAPLAVEQLVIDAFYGKSILQSIDDNMTLRTKAIAKKQLFIEPNTWEELAYAIKVPKARLCLLGQRHAGRSTVACSIAHHQLQASVLEVDASREFELRSEIPVEIRLAELMRDALMSGSVLVLRLDVPEKGTQLHHRMQNSAAKIRALFEDFPAPLIIITEDLPKWLETAFGNPHMIRISTPTQALAQEIWKHALALCCSKKIAETMASMFARNYTIPTGQIFNIVQNLSDSMRMANSHEEIQSHHILSEIRNTMDHQLGSLADITVSDIPISGVVLPAEARAQVNEIIAYANNLHHVLDSWGFRQRSPYGNALSVLFTGPPGTGKTLLACALANELGKVLYRVDLSRIVDKYIGETEKNLARIFDEAARAQAIILFDEADSLFSSRTDVKSSNDRYANLEVNYLLQKLESYDGMTILTSNLSKSIDDAFKRRIRFIIDFPMPDVESRTALWQRMMPPNAPLAEDIYWPWLAKTFEMSGGHIRNAVLKAAISASAANAPISMEHLAKAAEEEARSLGNLMRITEDYEEAMHPDYY